MPLHILLGDLIKCMTKLFAKFQPGNGWKWQCKSLFIYVWFSFSLEYLLAMSYFRPILYVTPMDVLICFMIHIKVAKGVKGQIRPTNQKITLLWISSLKYSTSTTNEKAKEVKVFNCKTDYKSEAKKLHNGIMITVHML